jgi:hypothetical protein
VSDDDTISGTDGALDSDFLQDMPEAQIIPINRRRVVCLKCICLCVPETTALLKQNHHCSDKFLAE